MTATTTWSPSPSLPCVPYSHAEPPPAGCVVTGAGPTPDTIVVYQAFNDGIADYAVENQRFAGAPGFSETRMTWIKPNWLWMMYRCGWTTKDRNQTRVLALTMPLSAFNDLVAAATVAASDHNPASEGAPGRRIRVQWDPHHKPDGNKVIGSRAIQIGIGGPDAALWAQGRDGPLILAISDATPFARAHADSSDPLVPVETPR